MLQFLEETETCSNSEADNFHHRPKARKPIYRVRQSQGPSRPHISSVTSNFKERGDKIDSVRPTCSARPASCISSSVCVSSPWRVRRGPSGAPLAPQRRRWRGIYGRGPDPASAFFRRRATFFRTPDLDAKYGGSRNLGHHDRDLPAIIDPRDGRTTPCGSTVSRPLRAPTKNLPLPSPASPAEDSATAPPDRGTGSPTDPTRTRAGRAIRSSAKHVAGAVDGQAPAPTPSFPRPPADPG